MDFKNLAVLICAFIYCIEGALMPAGGYKIRANSWTNCPNQGSGMIKLRDFKIKNEGDTTLLVSGNALFAIPFDDKVSVKVDITSPTKGILSGNGMKFVVQNCQDVNKNTDGIFGDILVKGGANNDTCPFPKGTYSFKNFTIDTRKIKVPSIVPQGRYKATIQVYGPGKELAGCFIGDFTLKK